VACLASVPKRPHRDKNRREGDDRGETIRKNVRGVDHVPTKTAKTIPPKAIQASRRACAGREDQDWQQAVESTIMRWVARRWSPE
jgi:hypothetical protein